MTDRPHPAAPTTGYTLHPDVVWIPRPDGSTRLMHMSANLCAIDAASTALLTSIIETGAERSASELASRFEIDYSDAREDVEDFIAGLREHKLIQPLQRRKSSLESLRHGIARALVATVARLINLRAWSLQSKVRGLLWTVRWAIAQFGWVSAVREWERIYPQPAVNAPASLERLEAIDRAVRQAVSRSLTGAKSKERSLVCLALVRQSGIRAQLIVGVSHNPMHGHVWVEAEGRIISDDPEHYRSVDPVARYG